MPPRKPLPAVNIGTSFILQRYDISRGNFYAHSTFVSREAAVAEAKALPGPVRVLERIETTIYNTPIED